MHDVFTPFENKAQHTKAINVLHYSILDFVSSLALYFHTHMLAYSRRLPPIVGWQCTCLARLGKVRCRQYGMTARRQGCTRHTNSHTRTCSCTVSCIGLRVRLHLIDFFDGGLWGKERGFEDGDAVAL